MRVPHPLQAALGLFNSGLQRGAEGGGFFLADLFRGDLGETPVSAS
jgi:hypothetical protein